MKSEGVIELIADPAKPPVAQLYAASPWVKRARSARRSRSTTFRPAIPGGRVASAAAQFVR